MQRKISLLLQICLAFNLTLLTHSINADSANWSAKKTEHGQPDLQGSWYFGSKTPYTRPSELGDKQTYSTDEALAMELKTRKANLAMDNSLDPNRGAPELGGQIGFKADFDYYSDRTHELALINGEYRTSLIIDPPDGQMPRNKNFVDYTGKRKALGIENYDGPDSMDIGERCLSTGPVGSLYPMPWNANLQIVQTQNYVMIATEMIHDARVIRLNSEHRNHGFPNWGGDSIGYWKGDTLIVHTNNFRPDQSGFMMPISEQLQLTERFTPIGEDEILYSYTMDDPQAYTRPFTVELVITRLPEGERIYEFACHEGNYSMIGLLAGARKEEQDEVVTVSTQKTP